MIKSVWQVKIFCTYTYAWNNHIFRIIICQHLEKTTCVYLWVQTKEKNIYKCVMTVILTRHKS